MSSDYSSDEDEYYHHYDDSDDYDDDEEEEEDERPRVEEKNAKRKYIGGGSDEKREAFVFNSSGSFGIDNTSKNVVEGTTSSFSFGNSSFNPPTLNSTATTTTAGASTTTTSSTAASSSSTSGGGFTFNAFQTFNPFDVKIGSTAPQTSSFVFSGSQQAPSTNNNNNLKKKIVGGKVVLTDSNPAKEIDSMFSSLPNPPIFGVSSEEILNNPKTTEFKQQVEQSLYSILKMSATRSVTSKITEIRTRRETKKIQINPYDRDLILDSSPIVVHAFKPLFRVVAPFFCENVICNEVLLQRLENTEITTLNFFINMIYTRSVINNFSFFTNLPFLVFLMDVSKEDFMQQKNYLVHQIAYHFLNPKNAIDTLVGVDKYIALRKEIFTEDVSHMKLLDQFRTTCLEYIGTNSALKEFDFNQDPRVKNYVLEFYRYKQISRESGPGFQLPIVMGAINNLYNVKEGSDAVVKIPTEGEGGFKTIYCHKTILSSVSEMLEVNFGPNWSNEEDEEGRAIINVDQLIEVASDPSVMEYVIEFAYGLFVPAKVTSKQVLPLIKAAHFYRIQGLIDECLYLCVTKDKLSFFEVAESLEDHFEDETMDAFEDVMVEIGSANVSLIIGATNEELMRLPKRLLVKIFKKIYSNYANRNF